MLTHVSVLEKHELSSSKRLTRSSAGHEKTSLLGALRRRRKMLAPLLAMLAIGCDKYDSDIPLEDIMSRSEQFGFNDFGQTQGGGAELLPERQPFVAHVGEMNPWIAPIVGGRHEEYGAHILDTYADEYSGLDVHGRLADVLPLVLSYESLPLLKTDKPSIMTISQAAEAPFGREVENRVFDKQSEALIFFAGHNMSVGYYAPCTPQVMADARRANPLHMADTLVRVGSATEQRDGRVAMQTSTRCGQMTFTVKHPALSGERPYVYWRTRDEYIALLAEYDSKAKQKDIDEKLAEYDQWVANGWIQPGEMTTRLAGNSFAAPHAGAMGAAMLALHPDFDSQEAFAVLLSGAQPFDIIHNGEPVHVPANGAGFYYDDQSVGFGYLKYEILEKRARLMDDVLRANPHLETEQVTASKSGQKLGFDGQTTTFEFNINKDFIGYRAIITTKADTLTVNGGIADVKVVRPDGYSATMVSQFDMNGYAVLDTEQVFGASTQGAWKLITEGKFSSASIEVKGVAKGGPVGLFLPHAAAQLAAERNAAFAAAGSGHAKSMKNGTIDSDSKAVYIRRPQIKLQP